MTSVLALLPDSYIKKHNFEDKDNKNDLQNIIGCSSSCSYILRDLSFQSNKIYNYTEYECTIFKVNCLKMYIKNRKEITSILQKKIDLIGISFSEKAIYNKIFSYLSLDDILILQYNIQ